MKNFVQQGHTITIVFPYGVTSGGGVQVGNVFGVASNTQLTGDNGDIQLTGVLDIAKDASVFADDAAVYWNNTTKLCTSSPNGSMHIGVTCLATPAGVNAPGGLTGDATVRVRLNGAFPTSPSTSAVRFAHFLYDFSVDGGASCTPANSDTIPANAVVTGGVINATTAVTAAGSATVSVGTVAGSSATSILGVTGKASFSLDAVLAAAANAAPFKMSAAGKINIAVATGPLTAGVIEGWVQYLVATNA